MTTWKDFLVLVGRRLFYPANDGTPIHRDPTHGRIDRDLQWLIHDSGPSSLGTRVAIELTMQARRDGRTDAYAFRAVDDAEADVIDERIEAEPTWHDGPDPRHNPAEDEPR
jgi:hypothetical protein